MTDNNPALAQFILNMQNNSSTETDDGAKAQDTLDSDNNLTFESAMKELENISRLLSSPEIKLDDMVKYCERGAILYKFCQNKLDQAKIKIEEIVSANND